MCKFVNPDIKNKQIDFLGSFKKNNPSSNWLYKVVKKNLSMQAKYFFIFHLL